MQSIAKAILRDVRISPRKARLVINYIRGMSAPLALGFLENTRRRANPVVAKLLRSAIANAGQKKPDVQPDQLWVCIAKVDGGRTLKRMRARAMGRGATIRKRTSHITIEVSDKSPLSNKK